MLWKIPPKFLLATFVYYQLSHFCVVSHVFKFSTSVVQHNTDLQNMIIMQIYALPKKETVGHKHAIWKDPKEPLSVCYSPHSGWSAPVSLGFVSNRSLSPNAQVQLIGIIKLVASSTQM